MYVNKHISLSKRLISGLLTCSMAISALSFDAFAISTNSTDGFDEDNIIGSTGMTITVDEEGNIIGVENSTNPSSNNKTEDKNNSSTINNNRPPSNEVDNSIDSEFNQYYSLIDDSVIQTDTLLVKTSDPDIFTDSTTVESNYKDVYILSFDSVAEAKYAYSYYVDEVDYISDLSNVFILASNNNSTDDNNDAIANLTNIDTNKNYSGYIALIDSGVNNNLANAYLSVFDDNGKDTNGHGTAMAKYIREENPNAKILSIKAFDGNTTNVANLYAAIMLAIESNVSVINLSLAGYNTEQNAIIKEAIQEALRHGITVIGAAGNYNSNAHNFIPGSVRGATIVGAVNSDFTKYSTSNYNADMYVVATSTSEATARLTGMISRNMESNADYDWDRVTTVLADADKYEGLDDSWTGTHSDKKAA